MNYSIFCDASFCDKTKAIGIGVVVLSDDGRVARHKTSCKGETSYLAEIQAIHFALYRIPKNSNVTVFSDCHGAVVNIYSDKKTPKKYKTIDKIKKKMKDFNMIHIEHLSDNSNNWIRECHNIACASRKIESKKIQLTK